MTYTIRELANRFHLELDGDASCDIQGVCGLRDNLPDCLSFVSSPKFVRAAKDSQIPAFITQKAFPVEGKINLFSDTPEYAIALVAELFLLPPMVLHEPIHSTAALGRNVQMGDGVRVGPNTVIGSNVTIGADTEIMAGAVVMDYVEIGDGCKIYPNVTIREGCVLRDRVIVQPGAVIGSDGYGFVFHDGQHKKIPQVGNVIIEDDVEVGANCTIDRGRFSNTIVGKGTKLDNLVHVAHNVKVGEHCLIVAQTGISGSTTLGNHVTLAGQTGLVGHIEVADGVTALGQSMISKSIKEPGTTWAGSPAKPAHIWRKAIARFYKDPKGKNNE
jgi:UDP-3-O-[3-hydroxymyristoyl] glucosamine N-acyltransferase